MLSDKWVERFAALAGHVATWSKDPRTKVGAVIVDPETKLVHGMGYNGFARGVHDTHERWHHRETKYKFVIHAERNALDNVTAPVKGCFLFVTLYPCAACAAAMIQNGIARIYCPPPEHDRRDEAAIAQFIETKMPVFIIPEDYFNVGKDYAPKGATGVEASGCDTCGEPGAAWNP